MSGYKKYRGGGSRYNSENDGYFTYAMQRDRMSGPYGGGGGRGRNYGRGNRSPGSYNQFRPGGRGSREAAANPWEDGVMPMGDFGSASGSQFNHSIADSVNQLKQMGSAGAMAFNILNNALSSRGAGFEGPRGSVYGRLGAYVPQQGSPRFNKQPWSEGPQHNLSLYHDKKKFIIKKSRPRFKPKRKLKLNPAVTKDTAYGEDKGDAENTPDEEDPEAHNKADESQEEEKEPMDFKPSEAEAAKDDAGEAEIENENIPEQKGDDDMAEPSDMEDPSSEVLMCHICDKQFFKTLHGFQTHIEGKNHNRLARVYLEKAYSMLDLLKAQSRLQSQQNIVKMRKMKGKIMLCPQCECPFKGGMNLHSRIRAHGLVSSFTRCGLCKVRYYSRADLEKHFLTLKHLNRAHKIWLRDRDGALKIRNQDYGFPEMKAMDKLHDAIHEIRISHNKTLTWNLAQVTAYDPTCSFGINYIERVPQFYCTICSKKILHTAKEALCHFSSQNHYKNYVAHLMALQDKKMEEDGMENLSSDHKEAEQDEDVGVIEYSTEDLDKKIEEDGKENQSSDHKETEQDEDVGVIIEDNTEELNALKGVVEEVTGNLADVSDASVSQSAVRLDNSTRATDTRVRSCDPDKSGLTPQATGEKVVTLNGDDVIFCEETVAPAQDNDVIAAGRMISLPKPPEIEIIGETDAKEVVDAGMDVEIIEEIHDVGEIDK